MVLPLIPILFTVGGAGLVSHAKAISDSSDADSVNENATDLVNSSKDKVTKYRNAANSALKQVGEEKITILNTSIKDFLDVFKQIKEVNYQTSIELNENGKLRIDEKSFGQLRELESFANSFTKAALTGNIGGALAAFGAKSLVEKFAAASTGTAISELTGIAASNATLSYLGGGSLATGGLGIAGGQAILGGFAVAPALLVSGIISSAKAEKKLEDAKSNMAKARKFAADADTVCLQCDAITRRAYMIYSVLAQLDAYFLPLSMKMKKIVASEGNDYTQYMLESQNIVASTVSVACTIKAVLDVALLNKDGSVTDESAKIVDNINKEQLAKANIGYIGNYSMAAKRSKNRNRHRS